MSDVDVVEGHNLLLAMDLDLLCLVLENLPDARPAWRLISSSKTIRSMLSSMPESAKPLLHLGPDFKDYGNYNGKHYVSYIGAMAVLKTRTCRVETAVIGRGHVTYGDVYTDTIDTVDLQLLLQHGPRLKRLVLVNVIILPCTMGFCQHHPLKELTLVNSSVQPEGNPYCLQRLRELTSLTHLALHTTDVSSLKALAGHPSLTSLSVGGKKWYTCRFSDDEEEEEEAEYVGMPSLSGIYKIPHLRYLDLSEGLEPGNYNGGFKLIAGKDFGRVGKCQALCTLHIPVCAGDDRYLYYLTRCRNLEKVVIYQGRDWDEEDGDLVSHDFLCKCRALKHVRSTHSWIADDPEEFFGLLARKLARSHPGLMVALPRGANDCPESDDYEAVEDYCRRYRSGDEDEEGEDD